MKYKIVAASKPWHKLDYIIVKKSFWFPFWVQANDFSYSSIEIAKKEIIRLKTNIQI